VPPNAVEPFDRPEKSRRVQFFRRLASVYSRVYHGLKIEQPCQIPRQGPVILVCNHTSGLDPPLIQTACPRFIRWMMAQEYFDLRALRWFYKLVAAIPVQRTGRDTAATRAAIRVLEQGLVLGVFAEGKIETTRELLPFQLGVGLLALRTGAPVFPAFLDGKQRGREMLPAFLLPAAASIRFGPPVDLTNLNKTKRGVEQATARIRDAMASLQKEHMDQL
jgi:1-acyl-sn-glycerol-3-phosphate acyltransferase